MCRLLLWSIILFACVMHCRQQNEEFRYRVSHLESAAECRPHPLSSFLMLPMQRITRMPLLVSTICERLETIPDLCCPREITRCLSVVQKVSSLLLFLSPQRLSVPGIHTTDCPTLISWPDVVNATELRFCSFVFGHPEQVFCVRFS